MSEERSFEVENELIEGRNAVIEALRAGRAKKAWSSWNAIAASWTS